MTGVKTSWDLSEQGKLWFVRCISFDRGAKRIAICIYTNGLDVQKHSEKELHDYFCRAKQQQYKADIVLLVEDIRQTNQKKYFVNWIYFENEYVEDLEFIKTLQQPGGIIPENWDFSKIARPK